jgi:DNA-binding NarL/FixJ family response regulator
MSGDVVTLVAARPGRVRDGLQALLAAIPQIEIIGHADDGASALECVAEHKPALVLLDTNLPDGQVWTVLKQIKMRCPQARCLIISDTSQQRQAAKAAGADGVLLKGFLAAELVAVIKELCLLSQ